MAGTGSIPYGDDLKRRAWMRKGMVEKASTSLFAPYTGSTSDAVVYQENNENSADGHTVVFDFTGKLTGKAVKGRDTAYGKGEIKRRFSDKITVERYRIPVNNGDKFDGVDSGDLTINEHSDSRTKLIDLWIRWKDQMLIDAAQGGYVDNEGIGGAPTHIYYLDATFSFNDVTNIEQAIRRGKGFKTGSSTGAVTTTAAGPRAPLEPFMLKDGEPMWLFFVDSVMSAKLKTDEKYQTINQNADIRGPNNKLLKSVIGTLGRFVFVEFPDFFGFTEGAGAFGLEDSEIEIAGLRQYYCSGAVGAATALTAWSGQDTFVDTDLTKVFSRSLIMGQSALQLAMGKMPDYKWKKSQDFDITSEPAVEFWTDAKKTKLKLEGGSVYKQAKITGVDYGVIAVDYKNA